MAPLRTITTRWAATGLTAAGLAAALSGACTAKLTDDGVSAAPPVDSADAPLTLRPTIVSRLNRLEYNNTVRDLLGTSLKPADAFPADGMAGGFDTVGSALSLSPTYVIAYERAAHELIAELFASETPQRASIVSCDVEEGDPPAAEACAHAILSQFARRAWRRPVTDEEVETVLLPFRTALDVGAPRTDGLQHSLAAVLMSPFFLFKLEVDEDPSATEPRPLNPYELATRLSYTLWSTLPDEELMAVADAGELSTAAQVAVQVDRMLADPRSDALLDSFAGHWLEFKRLPTHEVERSIFPEYDAQLADSMQREAYAFVREFLHSERPVVEMLTAGFTYVDARLAAHYGMTAPDAEDGTLVRVDTAGTDRVGLLTLGGLLTTTSFSSRTSPVRRGEFVFSHLLCGSIPPPPPEVEGLPIDEADGLTLRQRLERHREDPSCSGCHNIMDPLGFGLENYDAIGRYRTHEGTLPVDASGELDGAPFDGGVELSHELASNPRVAECVTRKFIIYAGNRLLASGSSDAARNDAGWVRHIDARAAEIGGGSLRAIIVATLTSDAFRTRVPNGT